MAKEPMGRHALNEDFDEQVPESAFEYEITDKFAPVSEFSYDNVSMEEAPVQSVLPEKLRKKHKGRTVPKTILAWLLRILLFILCFALGAGMGACILMGISPLDFLYIPR